MPKLRAERAETTCALSLAVVIAAACSVESVPASENREVTLIVEQEVGLSGGDPAYVFGSISGIAIDSTGRVFLADAPYHRIRILDSAGVAQFTYGTRGEGPGDILQPCCLAFDTDGRLWVRSTSDKAGRYDVFHVGDSALRFAFRVSGASTNTLQSPRTLFDTQGNIVHPVLHRVETDRGVVRLVIDTSGAELRRVHVPYVPPDSLGAYKFTFPSPLGDIDTFIWGPGSARHVIAQSPRGGFADAVTSHYSLRWFDEDGALVRTVERSPGAPLPFSAEERAEAAAKIETDRGNARRMGGALPDIRIPVHKLPLRDLTFDLDGRLWVMLAVAAADTMARADVFDEEGNYMFTARWPARISIRHGASSGNLIYGVSRDELDVSRLVRLRIPSQGR